MTLHEGQLLRDTLKRLPGGIGKAAEDLGMTTQNLHTHLRKVKLKPPFVLLVTNKLPIEKTENGFSIIEKNIPAKHKKDDLGDEMERAKKKIQDQERQINDLLNDKLSLVDRISKAKEWENSVEERFKNYENLLIITEKKLELKIDKIKKLAESVSQKIDSVTAKRQ